ncbi:MAG TPA: AAA family ATPase [Terriglobales bacterium]|nr:AAA family ATPase [Terriglobales bacterium]
MLHHNSNLVVISGGPGSGKTTVLCELAKLGFQCAPEVARQIIQEQVRDGGTMLPWQNREAYTQLMLQRSIDSYLLHTPALRTTFSDRGIPDTLGYARLIALREHELMQDILAACHQYRYASVVFLAPPWKEIYETDRERKQDFAESERTFEQITEVYRECGYELLELPRMTPAARARFILHQIKSP